MAINRAVLEELVRRKQNGELSPETLQAIRDKLVPPAPPEQPAGPFGPGPSMEEVIPIADTRKHHIPMSPERVEEKIAESPTKYGIYGAAKEVAKLPITATKEAGQMVLGTVALPAMALWEVMKIADRNVTPTQEDVQRIAQENKITPDQVVEGFKNYQEEAKKEAPDYTELGKEVLKDWVKPYTSLENFIAEAPKRPLQIVLDAGIVAGFIGKLVETGAKLPSIVKALSEKGLSKEEIKVATKLAAKSPEVKNQLKADVLEQAKAVKQPWEMTRDEYDLWRINELNRRNPQLKGRLKGEIVDNGADVTTRRSSDDMRHLVGGHYGSTLWRTKNARSGTWTHEIRHMIDMLLGGNQVRKFIGDIRANGDIELLKSTLKKLRDEGRIDKSSRLTNDSEIAQAVLDAFYNERGQLDKVAPDLVDFLEQMGADRYADLNTPHRKMVKQALSEGKPVPEEVLAEYPELKAKVEEVPKAKASAGPKLIDIVLKNNIVDEEATKATLPKVPKGMVRLFRAESPTVKFEDVFDKTKFLQFLPDKKQGEFWTTDLKYADYFRETYGPDAYIKYIDVPETVAAKGHIQGVEYTLPKQKRVEEVPRAKAEPEQVIPKEIKPVSQPKTNDILDKEISANKNNVRAWFVEPENWDNKKRLTYREVAQKIATDKDIEFRMEEIPVDPSRPFGKTKQKFVAYLDGKRLREFPKEVYELTKQLQRDIPKPKTKQPWEMTSNELKKTNEAVRSYEEYEVPEGAFVHGRYGRQDLDTGTVILASKDWDVAEQYAGKKGSKWLIRPGENTKILDARDASQTKKIIDALKKDYEAERLPLELDELIKRAKDEGLTIEDLAKEMNPANIVDSAALWDMPDFVNWFSDNFDYDMVLTKDGAAIINPRGVNTQKVIAHKQAIQQALSEGKPVPRQVLEEYKGEKWADEALGKLSKKTTKEPSVSAFAGESIRRKIPDKLESYKPGDELVKRSDIIKKLDEAFAPIRVGKFREKALGIYKHKPEAVRLKLANDVEVAAHEIGHHLQKYLGLGEPGKSSPISKFSYELHKIATPGNPDREGFAEFIRFYITDPQKAKRVAPDFYKFFDKHIEKYPEIKKVFDEVRRDFERWIKQPATAKVLAHISQESDKKPLPTFDDIYTATVDELRPIEKFVKTAEGKGAKIDITENPAAISDLMRGYVGKAEAFLNYKPINTKLEFVGESLKDILNSVDDLDAFRAYLVAKRAIELKRYGIESGVDIKTARATLRELRPKKYALAHQRLLKYQDTLLKYLVDSGVISPKAYAKMKILHQNYVPFYRVVETDMQGGKGRTFANLFNPVKRIKGSGRDIIDPLESIVKNTFAYLNVAERNNVGRAVVDIAEKTPGLGRWVERIPTPMQGIKTSVGEVANNFLKGEGEQLPKGFDDLLEHLAVIFRPSQATPQPNVITVFKNGKRVYYEVDPSLYKAMMALNKESVSTLTKLLSYPARWLRAGATLTPEFMGRNPIRDTISAFCYSNYGFIPGYDTIRGLLHVINKTDKYWQYKASGAAHTALVSMDRNYLRKELKGLLGKKSFNPLELLRAASELMEEGTRLGEFTRGLKVEGTGKAGLMKAGRATRDVTLNFARHGAKTQALNMITAFFNAQIQGIDKMVRAFRQTPLRTSSKVAMGITAPSVLLYLAQKDDPYYQELPSWRKNLFWNIVIHNDDGSLKRIISIPKPFELGVIFGSVPERVLEYIDTQDPKILNEVLKQVGQGSLPNIIPTFANPIIENYANRSLFLDRPIVPRDKEKLSPQYQSAPYTSETVKLVGKAISKIPGIKEYSSPAKIEHLIRGWTGGLGRLALEGADKILEKMKIVTPPPKPEHTLSDVPGIRAFVARFPSANTKSIEDFYDNYTKIETLLADYKYVNGIAKLKGIKNLYKKTADELSNLRKHIQQVYDSRQYTPEQKRKRIDTIYFKMINVARKALGKSPIKHK